MDLVTVQTIRIFWLDYRACGTNVTSTTAVSSSVATSSSESLPKDDEKLNQPKRFSFYKCNNGKTP